jgi:hypothetical protein
VSKHWSPEDELALVRKTRAKRPLPPGAVGGIAIVAAACLTLCVVLYQVAGPRQVVEEEARN